MQSLWLPEYDAFLRYLDLPGREPATVYLHCLAGASVGYLRTALDATLVGRRAFLIDLLGFGCSDRPAGFAYGLADHAQTVATLLERCGLRDCAVIGHSMGGSVAITLAALRPDLVARLIIAEAPLVLGAGSASRAIATQAEEAFCATGYPNFIASIRAEARDDATMATFLGLAQQAAPHALYRTAASMVRDTPTVGSSLRSLSLPRTYVWGARTLESADARDLAADLAGHGVASTVVPDAEHHMNLDNPSGFAQVIAQAIGRRDNGVGQVRSPG